MRQRGGERGGPPPSAVSPLLAAWTVGLTGDTDNDVPWWHPRRVSAHRLVVVAVSASRTVTDAEHVETRRFLIQRRQYIARGEDGLWRVDVAAVGG